VLNHYLSDMVTPPPLFSLLNLPLTFVPLTFVQISYPCLPTHTMPPLTQRPVAMTFEHQHVHAEFPVISCHTLPFVPS